MLEDPARLNAAPPDNTPIALSLDLVFSHVLELEPDDAALDPVGDFNDGACAWLGEVGDVDVGVVACAGELPLGDARGEVGEVSEEDEGDCAVTMRVPATKMGMRVGFGGVLLLLLLFVEVDVDDDARVAAAVVGDVPVSSG